MQSRTGTAGWILSDIHEAIAAWNMARAYAPLKMLAPYAPASGSARGAPIESNSVRRTRNNFYQAFPTFNAAHNLSRFSKRRGCYRRTFNVRALMVARPPPESTSPPIVTVFPIFGTSLVLFPAANSPVT
jgi:hypothetical protein